MKIRKGNLNDLEEIRKIMNDTKELASGEAEYSKEFVSGALTQKDRELVLVVEDQGKLVGFLLAEIGEHKKYAFATQIFVKKEYRGKGIASRLNQEAEKIFMDLKLQKIFSLVLVTNKKMQAFMKKDNYTKGHKFYMYEKVLK